MGDVAEALDVAPCTATRLVDRAVTAGTVAKRPGSVARKCAALLLTPEGLGLAERARAFRAARLERLLEGWDDRDRDLRAELLSGSPPWSVPRVGPAGRAS